MDYDVTALRNLSLQVSMVMAQYKLNPSMKVHVLTTYVL